VLRSMREEPSKVTGDPAPPPAPRSGSGSGFRVESGTAGHPDVMGEPFPDARHADEDEPEVAPVLVVATLLKAGVTP